MSLSSLDTTAYPTMTLTTDNSGQVTSTTNVTLTIKYDYSGNKTNVDSELGQTGNISLYLIFDARFITTSNMISPTSNLGNYGISTTNGNLMFSSLSLSTDSASNVSTATAEFSRNSTGSSYTSLITNGTVTVPITVIAAKSGLRATTYITVAY